MGWRQHDGDATVFDGVMPTFQVGQALAARVVVLAPQSLQGFRGGGLLRGIVENRRIA